MPSNIEPISPNIHWSSKAAATHAADMVEHDTPFLALWVDKDGTPRWSKANMTFEAQAQLSALLSAMVAKWALNILEQS